MRRPTPAVAVIAASVVLTLGVAGSGYAAGKITGADIKDGTVTSADLKNGTVASADLKDGSVTSGDIKNGTVTSGDLKDRTVTMEDLSPETLDRLARAPQVVFSPHAQGSYLPTPAVDTTFHSINVPPGTWLVTATATVFPHSFTSPADVQCTLKTATDSGLPVRTFFEPEDGYDIVSTQMLAHAGEVTAVDLVCNGDNFGVNNITMSAIETSPAIGD
jgi:hypothetical protein